MAMRKSERLMNLLIMLLVARRHLDKEHIRTHLYPEQGTEAFERMFERDKEELRQLGVPIDMASANVLFEDEQGYRIHRRSFELPEISLEADEAAVVGLAARVWQHAGLAGATSDALVKLKAAGVEVDRTALDVVEPRLNAEEPSFDAFWAAAQSRSPVAFDYRRSGSATVTRRHLQPWRVAWSTGRWYVLGLDTDRGEPRLFRLSRVQGDVETGAPGSYDLPTDVDFRAMTRALTPRTPTPEPAVVLVRRDTAYGLRRQAGVVTEDVPGPDTRTAWDRLVIKDVTLDTLADDVLSFADEAYVEGPPALRDLVVARLDAVLA